MSATEEIQAAIEKLTALKSESTPGPWEVSLCDPSIYSTSDEAFGGDICDINYDQQTGAHRPVGDANLIVTLHATIDAQIGLLEVIAAEAHGCNVMGIPLNTSAVVARGLTLARAINGGA